MSSNTFTLPEDTVRYSYEPWPGIAETPVDGLVNRYRVAASHRRTLPITERDGQIDLTRSIHRELQKRGFIELSRALSREGQVADTLHRRLRRIESGPNGTDDTQATMIELTAALARAVERVGRAMAAATDAETMSGIRRDRMAVTV